jgi:hypothetical protein
MANHIQSTHRDIAWFKQAHELGQLQMRPPYQRNPVWTTKQKSFLIDSILNGYPVPEIYMQDIVELTGDKKYVIVDGQQRITACIDYIYGKFSIDSKDSPTFADLTFDDLKPEQKKVIYSYQFVVRLLPEISEIELREIFQRLNRNNVALNQQELRQATYWGQFIQTMNELSEMETWSRFNLFTPNDVKRMLDVEYISELAVAAMHDVQNKKLSIDKYYELYEEEFPERNKLKETFELVLRELISVLPNIGETRWAKKTDFYTLFVLFSKKRNLLPLGEAKKQTAREILSKFAAAIDKFVTIEKEEGDVSAISPNVKQYSLNLRASSDLGARRKREEALDAELESLWT